MPFADGTTVSPKTRRAPTGTPMACRGLALTADAGGSGERGGTARPHPDRGAELARWAATQGSASVPPVRRGDTHDGSDSAVGDARAYPGADDQPAGADERVVAGIVRGAG